jgi:YVTN family beta-propeller protein
VIASLGRVIVYNDRGWLLERNVTLKATIGGLGRTCHPVRYVGGHRKERYEGSPYVAISVDSALGHAFAVNHASNTVGLLDTVRGSMQHTTAVDKAAPISWVTTLVGKAPITLGVDTTPGRAFVTNTGSDTVSVIHDKTGSELRVIPEGQLPIDRVEDVGGDC